METFNSAKNHQEEGEDVRFFHRRFLSSLEEHNEARALVTPQMAKMTQFEEAGEFRKKLLPQLSAEVGRFIDVYAAGMTREKIFKRRSSFRKMLPRALQKGSVHVNAQPIR